MDPILLLACIFIGLSVALFVYVITTRNATPAVLDPLGAGVPSPPPSAPSLASLAPSRGKDSATAQTSNLHEVLLQRSRSERVVKPWLDKVNSVLTGATPKKRIEALHEQATTAGLARTWTRQRITTVRTIGQFAGVALGLLAFSAIGGFPGVLFAVIVAGIGFKGFDIFIAGRAKARQDEITRELPDIADQIAISVSAGLSFEQAIRRTVDSTDGPMSEELARFLYDTRVGMPRQVAFKNLQDRIDVPDVTSFVRAIAQAEKTGVSIAEILQIQSDELRIKREQRAEERAQRLPVLMLLPLVTCILPPLLIVLLGPAVIQVRETGFGG